MASSIERVRRISVASVYPRYIAKAEGSVMREIRDLDRLVDELIRGKAMEEFLRSSGD